MIATSTFLLVPFLDDNLSYDGFLHSHYSHRVLQRCSAIVRLHFIAVYNQFTVVRSKLSFTPLR